MVNQIGDRMIVFDNIINTNKRYFVDRSKWPNSKFLLAELIDLNTALWFYHIIKSIQGKDKKTESTQSFWPRSYCTFCLPTSVYHL